ncbi:MAG: hypothetical protein ABI895_39920 [Deltaproteobacteria bacterium]
MSRRPSLEPLGLRLSVASGLVFLASCGTGQEERLFPPVETTTLPATPAASPPQSPGFVLSPGALDPAPLAPATDETGSPPPMTPIAPAGASPAAGAPGSEAPATDGADPDPMDDDASEPPLGAPLSCPPAASFCTSFEGEGLPAGATYVSQRGDFVPGQSLLLDSAQRFSGERSLLVPADTLVFDYRMLSVAVPGNDFWVRLQVRTDVLFGDGDVDTLFLASVLTDGFNGDRPMQLSEQFDQVVLNKNGQVHGATRENPMPGDPVTRLAADEWHCLEVFFGGTSGDMQVFLAGEPIITALGWQPEAYRTFRFGYERFSTARNVWIDDVAVALERIGCE